MRNALVLLGVLLVIPSLAAGQSKKKSGSGRQPTVVVRTTSSHSRDCCWGNRFSLEPYGGAMKDVYDISPDHENTSYVVGFRLGYVLGSRTRLLGNVAYSESDDIADSRSAGSYYLYDNTWVFTTGGAEFDVIPGRTSAALGVQAGAAWRRVDVDGQVGVPFGASQKCRVQRA